ncbi:cell death protein 3-like isoform X2 [Lytechinus variegatus]|nr:cell death protein 3-like isoform X2 [Lytechinus variegatus]
MTIEGRELAYETRYRFHNLKEGWVHDCRMTDLKSGVEIEVRHRKGEHQVIKEAVQKVFQELESRGLLLEVHGETNEEGESSQDARALLNDLESTPDDVEDPPLDTGIHEDETGIWSMFLEHFKQDIFLHLEALLSRIALCLLLFLAAIHFFKRKSNRILQTSVARLLVDDIEPDGDGLYKHLVISPAMPTIDQLDSVRNYDSMYRSPQKGVAYILNNRLFSSGRERRGSEVDLENVQHLFTQLGYETIIDENATAEKIRRNLDSLVRRINREGVQIHSSLVLFLMSHGTPRGILGADELEISIEEIMGRLSAKNCHALVEKPKIVFIQACRGQNLQQSAVDGDSVLFDSREEPEDCLRRRGVATDDGVYPSSKTTPDHSLEVDSLPDNTDIYVAYATSYGYFSVRDTVKGSWFVQATCEEFIAGAHIDDLDTMMESVTRRVTRLWGRMKLRTGQEVTMLQTPDIRKQGVRRKIYFAPKYPTSESA